MTTEFHYFLSLIVAVLCGAVVGIDRERRGKPAGIRTCAFVALGSALYTVLSYHFSVAPNFIAAADPTRIAAQIVSGIGFLGAGTIMIQKNHVVGLTTAAIVWVVAAVGMAAGLGAYFLALSTTALMLSIVYLVQFIENKYHKDK